jgi:serine/threonine protein kinase
MKGVVYEKSKRTNIESDYYLKEQIGAGTYSTVRLGINKKSGDSVAIKILSKNGGKDALVSLATEIKIMDLLKEAEYVVRLQDVYETTNNIMLVLDLVVGGELFEKIAAKGNFSEKDAAYALRQMCTALSQLHSKRIVHRDLKPENILCTYKQLDMPDDIRIADFGESVQLEPGTFSRELRGSPCYIAPEIWLNQDYDMAADMWSLGVIAFTLLGGYLPFEVPEPEDDEEEIDELKVSESIIKGEYIFHPEVWGDTSHNAKDFVMKVLEIDPKKRFTAAEALQHPFIASAETASTVSRSKAMENLINFNEKRKWKAIAQMFIATNRLKTLSGLSKNNQAAKKKPDSARKKSEDTETQTRTKKKSEKKKRPNELSVPKKSSNDNEPSSPKKREKKRTPRASETAKNPDTTSRKRTPRASETKKSTTDNPDTTPKKRTPRATETTDNPDTTSKKRTPRASETEKKKKKQQ